MKLSESNAWHQGHAPCIHCPVICLSFWCIGWAAGRLGLESGGHGFCVRQICAASLIVPC